MKKDANFTDAEVYETEKLCLEKFQQFKFEPIDYDTKENIVIIKNPEIESLVNTFYKDRYSKDENGNIRMSFYIFSLLEKRFFPNNQSVKIKYPNWEQERDLRAKSVQYKFFVIALLVLERGPSKEIIQLLNQQGFKVRTYSNKSYNSDIEKIKTHAEKLLQEINPKLN
jgi:hypothetical protein